MLYRVWRNPEDSEEDEDSFIDPTGVERLGSQLRALSRIRELQITGSDAFEILAILESEGFEDITQDDVKKVMAKQPVVVGIKKLKGKEVRETVKRLWDEGYRTAEAVLERMRELRVSTLPAWVGRIIKELERGEPSHAVEEISVEEITSLEETTPLESPAPLLNYELLKNLLTNISGSNQIDTWNIPLIADISSLRLAENLFNQKLDTFIQEAHKAELAEKTKKDMREVVMLELLFRITGGDVITEQSGVDRRIIDFKGVNQPLISDVSPIQLAANVLEVDVSVIRQTLDKHISAHLASVKKEETLDFANFIELGMEITPEVKLAYQQMKLYPGYKMPDDPFVLLVMMLRNIMHRDNKLFAEDIINFIDRKSVV